MGPLASPFYTLNANGLTRSPMSRYNATHRPIAMQYRAIADTGIEVSAIGLDLWPLSAPETGRRDERESLALLSEAIDLGVTLFDTADVHGRGYGEELLARALGRGRSRFVIATKVGFDFYSLPSLEPDAAPGQNFSADYLRRACEQCLRRLKSDHIDLLHLHFPPWDALESDEMLETMEALAREGKVRCWGVAVASDAERLDEGAAAVRERRIAALQVAHNVLWQEHARAFATAGEPDAPALLCRAPHASGLLDGAYDTQAAYPGADERLLDGLRKLRTLDFLTRETEAAIGQVALQFVLADGRVAAALPAVTSAERLREFAAAGDLPPLDADTLSRFEALYASDFYPEGVEPDRG